MKGETEPGTLIGTDVQPLLSGNVVVSTEVDGVSTQRENQVRKRVTLQLFHILLNLLLHLLTSPVFLFFFFFLLYAQIKCKFA